MHVNQSYQMMPSVNQTQNGYMMAQSEKSH